MISSEGLNPAGSYLPPPPAAADPHQQLAAVCVSVWECVCVCANACERARIHYSLPATGNQHSS